ncbi:hypothetical protein HYH03_011884 [Edaphochlamys debaryana]|uniref:DUF7148 domain-containing protein n=1 Tax=Edaphochlamys debaryana TaxID=47281 RepID=A0A835Y1X6_9CHLO|nr:hypothetical protein HYH03_011884 [Edaphochlamys debaryana]|eukprot:KAG2489604.1 hypothetical protein HYH03_011884 [Edaphochlamys debaryana]
MARGRATTLRVCASLRPESQPHIQLGTAKLPATVNQPAFVEYLYQWAATVTQSGANYPFVMPMKVDKYDTGFKVALLKQTAAGNFDAAAEIQGTLEEVPGKGTVVFFRFFEGPAASAMRSSPPPADPKQRLSAVIDALPDVDTLMGSMPEVMRKGVQYCQ